MTDERTARMGLAAAQNPGDAGLAMLVHQRGAVEVWDYLRSGHGQTLMARRAAGVDVHDLVRQTGKVGARFVIPGDDEWPIALKDLSWSALVGGVGGEPSGLWVIGSISLAELGSAVAIVGSRASTAYGEHVASDWAVGIAERGYSVISGGAFGIDACAHRGALAADGVTVAVMAGGLETFYPSSNTALMKRIVRTGAVVSEFPPTCHPTRASFLVRNRLIAALAKATVIVEGAVRSGAQNTVSWALSLQRPVLAVPGPVTSAMSVTPHRLIRTGEATLVTCVDEVLAALEPIDSAITDYQRDQPTLFDTLTPGQRKVHEALPLKTSVCVDELYELTGESVVSLAVYLAQLKELGLVHEQAPGMWRVAPKDRR